MTTNQQNSVSRRGRIGRSVEVQHAYRGLVLMLRRGLHGSKNWVLEPEQNGLPRSVVGKMLRTAVVLLPVWIVLSVMTGGPQRGGQDVGALEALLTAVAATLIGLGVFSARERRAGREEPWADLPNLSTQREESGAETLVDPAPEAPTEVVANAQVSEVGPSSGVVTPSHNPGVSDQTPQIDTGLATPVVTPHWPDAPQGGVNEDPFVQVRHSDHIFGEDFPEVDTSPETDPEKEGINRHIPGVAEMDTPTIDLTALEWGGHPVTVSLEKQGNPQVNTGDQVETATPGNLSAQPIMPTTEGDKSDGAWGPAAATPEVVTHPVQGSLFPQVSLEKDVETGVATPVATPAKPGPYEVTPDPLARDWFLTKPDVETKEEAVAMQVNSAEPEAPQEESSQQVSEGDEEASVAPDHGTDLDQAVLLYRAFRDMPNVTDEEKEAVRQRAIEWARQEIAANRQSHRSAAQLLGVSHATVAKWLKRDPWAEVQGE